MIKLILLMFKMGKKEPVSSDVLPPSSILSFRYQQSNSASLCISFPKEHGEYS